MCLAQCGYLFRCDHVGHGAVGFGVGQQNALAGIENFCAFAHKGHAAHHQCFLRQIHGQFAQIKGIADVISHFLHFVAHIVVGQNHSILFLFQPLDRFPDLHNEILPSYLSFGSSCRSGLYDRGKIPV